MRTKISMLAVVVFALTLSSALAPSAEAKAKNCVKRGYSLAEKSSAGVVMTKRVKDKKEWASTATAVYVCSGAFGRHVHLGTFGISWDGEIAYGALSLSPRFAAWSEGTSDNAGGVEDEWVVRADLKTGKTKRWELPEGAYVDETAADESGAVSWSYRFYEGAIPKLSVMLANSSGVKQVGTGTVLGERSLLFDLRDGVRKLSWPTTVSSAAIARGTASVQTPKKAKRCGKSGYATESKIGATLVMQREVRGGIWDGPASRYYVCSQNYGKRVAVGTFGIHMDGEKCLHGQALAGRFAAFVLGGGGNAGGCNSDEVLLVDLKTGIKRSFRGSDMPRFYGVRSIVVEDDGTVAWIAAADPLHREVWSANLTSATKLAEGSGIDPLFLQLGLGDDSNRVAWATATSSVDAR